MRITRFTGCGVTARIAWRSAAPRLGVPSTSTATTPSSVTTNPALELKPSLAALATPVPHRWADAPAPAQVAKRIADAAGQGRRVTREDVPLLTNAMHWLYGLSWGAAYGAVRPNGLVFGTGVWAAAYAELVPLGIYKPPWKYPAKDLAIDWSYHAVYGVTVAAAYAALER